MAELGALSLRISEDGGQAVLTKLKQIDGAAKLTSQSATPLSTYFKKVGADASSGLGKATAASKALNKEIADGTRLFALNARTVDVTSKVAVAELRATAAAQREWLVSVGASTEQQERFNASVQRFEQRVGRAGVVVPQMNRQVRSGAAAMAALSIAAVTGGGSLAGMATQAGLVGTVMAAEFAPAKWAGYATGIGAAVIAVTALVGIMMKLRAEARKPREAITEHIDAIRIPDIAKQKADQLREERDALRAFVTEARASRFQSIFTDSLPKGIERSDVARLGPGGTIQKAENLLAQREAEFSKATARVTDLIGDAQKELETVAREGIVRAAEATRTVRLSEIAKEQAAVEAAFQQGTASLSEQYDTRRKAVVDGAKAEIDALRAAQAEKLKAVPGEDPKGAGAVQRQQEAKEIGSEIQALANETAARLTALDQQRAAEERSLTAKVLSYQVQLEQFSDTAFAKRMQQIEAEDIERRRTLAQRGNATAQELADLDALLEKQKAQLFLNKAQNDLARLQQDLDTRKLAIQQDLAADRITEVEAVQRTADAERSAVPTMQELVKLALQFAAALGDEGALTNLRNLEQTLKGFGEFLTPLKARMQAVRNQIADDATSTMAAVGARIKEMLAKAGGVVTVDVVLNAEALTESAAQVDSTFANFGQRFGGTLADTIAAAASGGSGKDALLAGLGGIFKEMGAALLTYGLTMSGLLPSLLNPFTSGPAAIAAGAALIALGGVLGAAATGRGGGSGRTGSTAPTPISISRLVIDPNAGVRQRIAGAGQQSIASAAPHPLAGVALLAVDKPGGAEYLATRVASYQRRGG